MVPTMATAKKTPAMKPSTPKPSASRVAARHMEGRKKSLLSRAGDEAKAAAERALLLRTLKAKSWNLTHTAEALEMGNPSAVLRAIDTLGLRPEYDAARGDSRS